MRHNNNQSPAVEQNTQAVIDQHTRKLLIPKGSSHDESVFINYYWYCKNCHEQWTIFIWIFQWDQSSKVDRLQAGLTRSGPCSDTGASIGRTDRWPIRGVWYFGNDAIFPDEVKTSSSSEWNFRLSAFISYKYSKYIFKIITKIFKIGYVTYHM